MKQIIALLQQNPKLSGFKVTSHQKQSYELFFVKGKLETVRRTDTCDKEVTVYVDHGEFKGDSQFYVYPSNSEEEIASMIEEAAGKAALLNNQWYELPAGETGNYEVESNFHDYDMADLAEQIAQSVFEAGAAGKATLNAVEIFVNQHCSTIVNSRGLEKTQRRYDAMVEAIPTYNGEKQSVELYEQYNFGSYDAAALVREIADKLTEVQARYEAVKPDFALECPVVLNRQELEELFMNIAYDLGYASVYSHSNLYKKGDWIQKERTGDGISLTMTGALPGSVRSACVDGDGLTLGSISIVENGQVVNYFGSNRYGQYLGETPTGSMNCMRVAAGTAAAMPETYLEIISMSGLQVDSYNDYIGGEIRLAYYHRNDEVMPLTGISVSGKLGDVLSSIRLSDTLTVYGGYQGPSKAILSGMTIF